MRQLRLAFYGSFALFLIAGGCACSHPSHQEQAPAATTTAAPAAPAAAAPVEPAASVPAASAARAPAVQPSWWTKPAPVIADHETLIAQADSTGAALAKQAAIDAGRAKLEKLGADVSRMEILNSTVTKVRFDGPFRAFVLVSAPKGTPQSK